MSQFHIKVFHLKLISAWCKCTIKKSDPYASVLRNKLGAIACISLLFSIIKQLLQSVYLLLALRGSRSRTNLWMVALEALVGLWDSSKIHLTVNRPLFSFCLCLFQHITCTANHNTNHTNITTGKLPCQGNASHECPHQRSENTASLCMKHLNPNMLIYKSTNTSSYYSTFVQMPIDQCFLYCYSSCELAMWFECNEMKSLGYVM